MTTYKIGIPKSDGNIQIIEAHSLIELSAKINGARNEDFMLESICTMTITDPDGTSFSVLAGPFVARCLK